jgi:hypothetical protein
MLLLSERSQAGAREDALIRASCLARAVYLRVLEARQDISALLRAEERGGETFLEARPLPWAQPQVQLYYNAPDDAMRVLPPGGFTNGQPFWQLPSRLAEGYSFFLTTAEGRMRGDRILPGINGFLRKDASPATASGAVMQDASWIKMDLVVSQRFFARQRLFDRLRPEFFALQEIVQGEFADVSLLIASDNSTVFYGGLDARLSANDIRLLSLYASRETSLARAFPMKENKVRAICGYDQNSGLVVADLQYPRALPPLELGLFLVSVFIPFAAVFVFVQSRKIEGKYFFLILFAFALTAGIVLINEAEDDYGRRSRESEIFKRDFSERHLEGEHPIQRAHTALFLDFALADMAHSLNQGKSGIYFIAIGTGVLTLFGIYALSVLFASSVFGHYGRQRFWCRAVIVLLGIIMMLALFGALFLASSEHQTASESGSAAFAGNMAAGLVLLLGQIIFAFPLSYFLASLNHVVRGVLLAFFFLPLFLSPLLFEFTTRFVMESEQVRPAIWYGLRFFAALPVTLLGFLYTAGLTPRNTGKALYLAGGRKLFHIVHFSLSARFLPALPIFALSYYLLLVSWPGKEDAGFTRFAIAGNSMPLYILLAAILLFAIFIRFTRLFTQGKGES